MLKLEVATATLMLEQTGSPSHACVCACTGMSPAEPPGGFQAEVPIAGIADQNLHYQLSHRRLILIVCNLRCAKFYQYIGQAA